jgi:hypothetical protein
MTFIPPIIAEDVFLSHPPGMMALMDIALIEQAIELLEKANADLEPELADSASARAFLRAYARVQRLGTFGVAAFAPKVDDAPELARVTGTSIGRAKETVATGKVMAGSQDLAMAMQQGDVSLEQATEIAKAEESAPGSATELLKSAATESFQVLRERARKKVLEAERKRGLGERQREARRARSYPDELGMINVHLRFQPQVGVRIVNRAEAEADRLAKAAKRDGRTEPFERFLADAYAKLLSGSGKGRARRPELVVLVSHEVVKRGWKDVREGELCNIPGVGPVSPQVAMEIAKDAFLNGVFYDGKDLRHFKRWTKHIPVEIQVALELGDPPDFDGVACIDCGKRFGTEFDHFEPRNNRGPTSTGNLGPRCWPCHKEKTGRDRSAGKLTPPKPGTNKRPGPNARE